VKKLKIGLREGLVLDGDLRGLAARFAATSADHAESFGKTCDPSGIRIGRQTLAKTLGVARPCAIS
jgi:hypothetical protein